MPYMQWLRERILRKRWFVWVTAAWVHWLIVLLLTMMIVHSPETFEELNLSMSFLTDDQADDPVELVSPFPVLSEASEASESSEVTSVDESVASVAVINPLAAGLDLPDPDSFLPDAVRSLGLKATDDGAEKSQSIKPAMQANAGEAANLPYGAASAGSFSVWTVPANPKRWEPYTIIIQIRLPDNIREYPLTDLEGIVVGSDGYRKPIPGGRQGRLPVLDGFVRLEVPIVSADARVQDTIYVKSRMLAEAQRLQIQF
ncbi:MAG: hypothetical protein JNL58_27160 [Planctomyces sp.]|nr:hypothetical protein [Planctomyces sp.]